jgi:hypothetical protein
MKPLECRGYYTQEFKIQNRVQGNTIYYISQSMLQH